MRSREIPLSRVSRMWARLEECRSLRSKLVSCRVTENLERLCGLVEVGIDTYPDLSR